MIIIQLNTLLNFDHKQEDEYKHFSTGIGSIQGHIFSGRINGENAGAYASEVMYLAACILTGQAYERIPNPDEYRDVSLKMLGIKKISAMRNADPMAYAYMVKSFQMLHEIGLYVDSVV